MAGDWKEFQFSELCDITRGASPRPIHDWISQTGTPWVKISDATASGSRFITRTGECIKNEARERSVVVHEGDLILSNSATPGIPKFMGIEACIHDGWLLLRNLRGLDKLYAFYVLLRDRPRLVEQGNGSVFTNLKTEILKTHRVAIPPLAEQKTIAAVLGALDDKIELNRRMNATLEAMARALFHSWFVDFDPVRAKLDGRKPIGLDETTAALFPDSFQESSLGHVPKGWAVKPLSELCQLGRGASPRPINDFMNGEVPWVKIADATAAGGPFLFATKEKVKKAGAEKSVAVAPGDLILSNSATCGVPMFVELHGCIHDGWLYFKNLRSISKLYLFHVLIELAEHLVHIADGSVQKNLNTNLVGQQVVLVPPKEIVDAFDSQATVWFAKMRQNGLESRTLAILRDTLLTKLLSGELQVADVASKTATHL